MKFRKMFVGLILLAAVPCVGCGDKLGSTLSGTVTHEGKPLAYAMLSFQFKGKGPAAYSLTDEEGCYYVRTGSHVGLLQGTYLVAVRPPEGVSIPEKYGSVQTSGLEYEVISGSNTLDIEL